MDGVAGNEQAGTGSPIPFGPTAPQALRKRISLLQGPAGHRPT